MEKCMVDNQRQARSADHPQHTFYHSKKKCPDMDFILNTS